MLGALFALQTPWALLPLPLLIHKKRVLQSALVFLVPCALAYQFYTFPASGDSFEGIFHIHSIRKSTRFGKGWSYSGTLKSQKGKIYCHCFSPEFHPTHMRYQLKGVVRQLKGKSYVLKPTHPWIAIERGFSLAEYRLKAQEGVKRYIEGHYGPSKGAQLIIGMVTGQLEDPLLSHAFSQLGLSHLMAISGLHFSLLALVLHGILRLFLPWKVETVLLLAFLTLYLLFVGETPSVARAWIAITAYLAGQILQRRTSALNALGTALLLSVLWNPISVASLGFQLSFLATAGILVFYPLCERCIASWLPIYTLKEAAAKSTVWQHSYITLSFIRKALALTCAVHIVLLPHLIATFHTLTLNSLFYNLFFPTLASAALLFFMVSIPFGAWAHPFNRYYCDGILKCIESPPLFFKALYCPLFPSWLLPSLLTSLLICALILKSKQSGE